MATQDCRRINDCGQVDLGVVFQEQATEVQQRRDLFMRELQAQRGRART